MIREPHQETLKVHKNPNLTFSLCVFSLIIFSKLSSGPHLPVRACSRTPPPGGDSTPPPGVGYGDGASERQSASGRAGFGEQGEGTSTEGQRPRRTGILNLPVNVFCVITDIVFFFFYFIWFFCSCWRSKSSSIRRREDDRPISIRCFSPACSESESVLLRLCWLLPNSVTFQPTSPYRETHSCIRSHLAHVHTGLH